VWSEEAEMNSNRILIIGAGTFSTEVEELAMLLGYNEIFFLDDYALSPSVIGKIKDMGSKRKEFNTAIVALGNNEKRKEYHNLLKSYNYNIPVLIHPTAYVSPEAQICSGCIIRSHAVVSRHARLGESVIVNVGGLVDHHCEIGNFSHVLMGAVVRNGVKIPEGSWINANEVVE